MDTKRLTIIATTVGVIAAGWAFFMWLGPDLPVRMSKHLEDMNEAKRLIHENTQRIEQWAQRMVFGDEYMIRQNRAISIRALNTELSVLRGQIIDFESQIEMQTFRLNSSIDMSHGDREAAQRRVAILRTELERVKLQMLEAERERAELIRKMREDNGPSSGIVQPRMNPPPP